MFWHEKKINKNTFIFLIKVNSQCIYDINNISNILILIVQKATEIEHKLKKKRAYDRGNCMKEQIHQK